MNTDVLIVGGGLSGLALACQLQTAQVDYHLVEARPWFGGRIDTKYVEAGGQKGYFDTGPTWFWPGQLRIEKLIRALDLTPFLQYADGELTFEDEQGQVMRGRGYASMAGSYRLEGGLSALVDGLKQQLKAAHYSLGLRVTALQQSADKITTTCIDADQKEHSIICNRLVLALPPRVAIERIQFSPALPPSAKEAMEGIPTWMAGQAKAIAIYERPFWREAGLSGDAMSRTGPMVEIHDASPARGGPFALFGFVGVPVAVRQQNSEALRQAAVHQLERLFGPDALNPMELIVQDWACEPETATPLDYAPHYNHPAYGLPHALANLWQGRLIFGSTEVAPNFGGYLEGALEASEIVLKILLPS